MRDTPRELIAVKPHFRAGFRHVPHVASVFKARRKSAKFMLGLEVPLGASWQEALAMELSSYVFSPLREGEFILYRGSGNGLAPVLLVAAEDASLGSVKRLEHE
jgi:hypothetical protein